MTVMKLKRHIISIFLFVPFILLLEVSVAFCQDTKAEQSKESPLSDVTAPAEVTVPESALSKKPVDWVRLKSG